MNEDLAFSAWSLLKQFLKPARALKPSCSSGHKMRTQLLYALWLPFFLTACSGQGGLDFSDPLSTLSTLAALPPAQQRAVLLVIGLSVQQQTGLDCNLFAGTSACKTLNSSSSFAQQCPDSDKRVDCAFYRSVQASVIDNPARNLETYMTMVDRSFNKELCPECFTNMQDMWCASAVPRCGLFDTYVSGAFLPSLTEVMREYSSARGYSQVEALAGAVERLFSVMALSQPCREICDAMLETCGCGAAGNETLGSLIEWMAGQKAQPGLIPPQVSSRLLFKRMWTRPFCSLFLPSTTPGFVGRCQKPLSSRCSNPQGWCNYQKGESFKYMQAMMLQSMYQTLTGWLSDPKTGLWRHADAITHPDQETKTQMEVVTTKGEQFKATVEPQSSGGMSGAQIAGTVFLALVGVAVLGGAAFFAYRHYLRKESATKYYELQAADTNYDDTSYSQF